MYNNIIIYGVSEVFPSGSKAFKPLLIREILNIADPMPDINRIVSISLKAEIDNTYTIKGTAALSCEGQALHDRQLITKGKILVKVEYTADVPARAVHCADFSLPFCTYIVLGKDMGYIPDFEVTGYIEDAYAKQLDDKRFSIDIPLLLNAVPLLKV